MRRQAPAARSCLPSAAPQAAAKKKEEEEEEWEAAAAAHSSSAHAGSGRGAAPRPRSPPLSPASPARRPAAPRPRPPPKLCKVGPRPRRPRPRLGSEALLAAAAAPRGGGGAAAAAAAASKRPNSRGLGGSHALRSVMSAEQEKDPISLKRVRGNREGRQIEGVGGSGVRGGRVPGCSEATGLCPGLTPRSPRPARAPGPRLRSEAARSPPRQTPATSRRLPDFVLRGS